MNDTLQQTIDKLVDDIQDVFKTSKEVAEKTAATFIKNPKVLEQFYLMKMDIGVRLENKIG